MLREDGTSYLNVLEVKTSIKLGGQEITATPTVTAPNVSFDPTGREFAPESTDVDLALVEAINRVKTLEDAGGGGGGGESAVNGKYTTFINNDIQGSYFPITNTLVLPTGWSEIRAEIDYNTTNIMTVYLKLDSPAITPTNGVSIRQHESPRVGNNWITHTFYINNSGLESTVKLALNQSSPGIVAYCKSMFTVKSLTTAPIIAYESFGGGGL